MHLRIWPMAYIIVKESMLDDGVVVWKEEGAGRIIVQSRKERMVYKEFQDLKISALGMGAMRLPVVDGNDGIIDEEKAVEMVDYAMENGINYYDTDVYGERGLPAL